MKHLLFFLLILTCITACKKDDSLPLEPSIEFVNIITYGNDSADCIISFKDGDGDIGILEFDNTSPDDLVMKYLYRDNNGVYVAYDSSFGTPQFDTLFYTYRVPDVSPEGGTAQLEGEIMIKLRSGPIFNPLHSFVKFEIRLRDRAGNWSNIAETSIVEVP